MATPSQHVPRLPPWHSGDQQPPPLVITTCQETDLQPFLDLASEGSVVVIAPSPEAVDVWLRTRNGLPNGDDDDEEEEEEEEILRILDLEIDLVEHALRWRGRPVTVTERELRILAVLGATPTRAFSFRDILQSVWGSGYEDDHTILHAAIRRLRSKLREAGVDVKVESVRGLGFRLRLPAPTPLEGLEGTTLGKAEGAFRLADRFAREASDGPPTDAPIKESERPESVLLIGGGPRRPSPTSALLRLCEKVSQTLGAQTECWDLADRPLPFFDPRRGGETERSPEEVVRVLNSKLAAVDAIIIVFSVYHNAYSGLVKNALDHILPLQLEGKPVGLASHGGGEGSSHAGDHIRQVIRILHGLAVPKQLVTVESDYVLRGGRFELANPSLLLQSLEFAREILWFAERLRNRGSS